jgi:hypothetical protein
MKDHRARTWAVLASLMAFLISACAAPTPAPTEALPPAPMPTEVSLGRISGRIEYQAPPTPASALYIVSVLGCTSSMRASPMGDRWPPHI